MVRTLALCLGALLALAPAALAATVSGTLAYCTGLDVCRYFSGPRLEVTFRAAPGEANQLDVLADPGGIRVLDAGAPIATGDHCTSVSEHEARCGPPAESGLVAVARTGDGADVAFVEIGSASLGSGDDVGRGKGLIDGGLGDDDIRSVGADDLYEGGLFSGGAGEDVLVGGPQSDELDGGRGPDVLLGGNTADELRGGRGKDEIAGGRGGDEITAGGGRDEIAAGRDDDRISVADGERDVVRCGPGRDRVDVDPLDVVRGCERVTFGPRD